MFSPQRPLVFIACALFFSALPTSAQASPWTLPEKYLLITLDSNFQNADQEFLPDGTLQSFPLQGEFSAFTFTPGARYGISDDFEVAFDFNIKQVSYQSDPIVLGLPDDPTDLSQVNASIFDFSHSETGLGDGRIFGRYNLYRSLLMVTSQTSLSFPIGYSTPRGTFSEDTPNPAGIQDDVTLGDGQTDLAQAFLFGVYIPPTNSFARLDIGYAHRFGPPGDQGFASLSFGQYIGSSVLVFAGARGAYTIFDGESIGQSFITRTPDKPSNEFLVSDVEAIDITQDKDYVSVEGGVILKVQDVEMRLSYDQVVWGANIPQIKSYSLGVIYAMDFRDEE
ncbi:hypothetical protein [Bradymonas sediminis]|uniref:Uncharacterized protein n=1 Tax=Bradymonas sediminis TaxID=1548548 RepID=A0A2Z4FJ51_9DELT|nr:hypothetical protein [Bradymonas sediminis]AWV88855.1 hypothetical protein DN745_05680 [Bradymonas sediminis]TDP71857.1 hypothetical protein DFR33_10871 [Bradymonas sediminis]